MLFNYHVKEMFRQCAFFFQNEQNGIKAVGPQCDDNTALTQIGTVTYCTL